jgi:hypothetical protein
MNPRPISGDKRKEARAIIVFAIIVLIGLILLGYEYFSG